MDLKDTYNKIARDWFSDHQADSWWVSGSEKFASLLPPGSKILDVGCGPGYKSDYFLKKGFQVLGIDFSEEMIRLAKDFSPKASFRVLDLYDLDRLNEKFFGVFAQAVLLHVPRARVLDVFGLLALRLVPGGHIYVAVKEKRPEGKEEEVLIENDYGYEYERFFSYYTMPELENYFRESGFEIVYKNISSAGTTRWLEVIARVA